MSKQLQLDVAPLTDVGRKRPHNEDNMAYVIPKDPQVVAKKGALFIVADGMGGHAAGEVASEIAVDTISKVYYQDDSDSVAVSLARAIKHANTLIHQRSAENMLRSGMGTTCVATVIRGYMAYTANVGDSRAYIIRDGQVKQVTQDHSWVAEQVRAGLLTEDQARSHSQRNVITRCLGTQADVEIDVFSEVLEEANTVVLCTDGLSGLLSDGELRTIVEQYIPQESVYHLVERANEHGGPDNITAIVVRVLEVGEEPPDARYPVQIGGHESIEEATLARFPTTALEFPVRAEDGRVTSAPLRLSSDPLPSPDTITAFHPVLRVPHRKRRSLFYPTLAVFILLVVSLVGASAYYVFHLLNPVDVTTSLTRAGNLVAQANGEVGRDPITALGQLARAQTRLRDLQASPLTDTQSKQLDTVQNALTLSVKSAITSYNQDYLITPLNCPNALEKNVLNTGSTRTQASMIAKVQDHNGKPFSYALGADHILYQLSAQTGLEHPFPFPGNAQVLTLTSDGSRLFALTKSATIPAQYSLSMVVPQSSSGLLTHVGSSGIDLAVTKDGQIPVLVTAAGTDVYVVLTNQTAPTSASILDFAITADNKMGRPRLSTISITAPLVGMAAFARGQLFLLQSSGSLQSMQLPPASSSTPATLVPSNVIAAHAIATPLPVSPEAFTSTTPVPTATRPAPAEAVLNLPGTQQTMMLVAGQVNGTQHLYILDGTNRRILDLKVASVTPANGTPAVAGTSGGASVRMDVLRQYASTQLLSHVQNMVLDPSAAQLDLLLQNQDAGGQQAIAAVNANPQNPGGCVQ